jgi:hypothetical protein
MQQSARSVAWRAAGVLVFVLILVLAGILVDRLTGLGPVMTLCALVAGVFFGTIMILVIVTSSFPRAAGAPDPGRTGDGKRDSL